MIQSRYFDDIGDGSGAKNMNGDYSGAVKEFKLKPKPNEIFHVSRILPFLKDGGSIDSGKYGNNITLINGINLKVIRKGADGTGNEVLWDLFDGKPVKVNPDWAVLCSHYTLSSYGAGDETLSARYSFYKDVPEGLILDGANGDELVCFLNDDFTKLKEHYIRAGFEIIKK